MAISKKFTGCRTRFLVNGVPFLFATRVSGEEEILYEPADVLDNVETDEHVVVGYRAGLMAGMLFCPTETLKRQKLFPLTGTTPQQHLNNILNQPLITAVIQDSATGEIVETYNQVKISRRSWQAVPRGLIQVDVGFVVIRSLDGIELAA